ncbi:MAG TPA: M14 family metallopeptidase [Bacteroidales bacterium]|nr:M14 family metallopeptidase [Bacteroidales bacterium]
METSHDSDVVSFCKTIGLLGPYAHVGTFGKTAGGNDLMMVILSDPAISTPEEASKSGKPVIYIEANIHAGEVEGKEASMQLIREICFGQKSFLLKNQILIFCPNYNPDGNDRLSSTSRFSQDGSPELAGARVSGEGYDLNREGIKAEALESKALLKSIIVAWDPALFIDLHTDNGSWHGYALNYAPDFLTAGTPSTTAFISDSLLPAAAKSMLDRSGIPVFFHGYMNKKEGEQTTYSTYSHLPRYLVNYEGLRNRMAILSETFSHDSFEKRILSNYLFLVSVLEYTGSHSKQIHDIVADADITTMKIIDNQAGILKKGVAYHIAPAERTIDLLTRETEEYKDREGRTRRRPTGRLLWIQDVRHYNHFEPDIEATVPFGYIFPSELKAVAEKLMQHGIKVSLLEHSKKIEAEIFSITRYSREGKASYGNHFLVKAEGSFVRKNITAPAGSYFVDMHQPLAWLAFYMLEPQSDDGLLLWNYFDDYLIPLGVEKSTVPYPVMKLMKPLIQDTR